jgi:hypothetical protein
MPKYGTSAPPGGSLLELLQEAAGALRRLRLDQEVKVFRHQDPTDQQKAQLLPVFPENLDEHEAEAVTVKEHSQRASSDDTHWK